MVRASEDLRQRVADHLDELGDVPWAWEDDRWAELVFCLINAHRGAVRGDAFTEEDALASRAITNSLAAIGLIEPPKLAMAGEEASDARAALRWVLAGYAYEPDDADSLIAILSGAATSVASSFDGKIQRFLRAKGEQVRDELTALLGADNGAVRQAVAHWLQNVTNLPLSVDDQAIRAFCADRGYSAADLEQAADEVGLNLALVDDVIRLHLAAQRTKDQ